MSKRRSLKPDQISILRFNIIEGEINDPIELDRGKIEGHTFSIGYLTGFNEIDKLARTDFQIMINTEPQNEKPTANAFYHFSFIFHIKNMDELLSKKEDGKMEVSSELGNALASISYSTSRGVLMSRFQGTTFQDFILPVIDPNEIMNKQGLIKERNSKGEIQ